MNTIKKNYHWLVCTAAIMLAGSLSSCSNQDKEIRQNIAGVAQTDLNFAGLRYTVADGVVHISGKCPSLAAMGDVQHALKDIHIIKAVDSSFVIAPVTLDQNFPLHQKIDSVLASYPQVTADLDSSSLRLTGKVPGPESSKLLTSLKTVCALPIDNKTVSY